MTPATHRERARTSVLSTGTLARFADGMTWAEILRLTSGLKRAFWRCAVADAENKGLLAWSRGAQTWILTPAGRAITRGVS